MGKPKTMLKKRTRSSVDNEKEVIPKTASSSREKNTFDEMVLCEILSRLPVKSLMRFKCVAKCWCSIIKDPYFIDLHSTRSKPLGVGRLLFIIPPPKKSQPKNRISGISYQDHPVCFKTADLLSEVAGRAISTIHSIRTSKTFQCSDILGAVNGLICFTNKFQDSVCVYNISTREVMPWVKSTLSDNDISGGIDDPPTYSFGFDPATKHYKVICNWSVYKDDGGFRADRPIWEVLTLGDNSWRRINEVPTLPYGLTSSSTYVNGSIYWFPKMFETGEWENGDVVCMMAFDVGSEKFRTIPIPRFIVDQPYLNRDCVQHGVPLIEVNGCLAIMRRVEVSAVKLWMHDSNDKEMGDESWNEQTITLPDFSYDRWEPAVFFFHSIAGTNQLILEVHQTKSKTGDTKHVSLYSYDWKNKTFKKMNISGIPSSIPVCISTIVCTSFIESLYSFEAEAPPHSTFNR